MPTIKTATIDAWLPARASIKAGFASDADPAELTESCGYSSHDMTSADWVRIGSATISIELLPTKTLTEGHVAALRKEQGELIAKANRVEQQIQQLLAIGWTGGAA